MPPDEAERLRVLHGLSILDTPAEEAFDRITRVLAHMLSVPIALVSLVDEHRQWFKSRVGVDACETSREVAFCTQMAQDVTARKQAERQLIAQAMRDPLTGLPNRRALTGHLAQHLASDRATRQALALFFLDLDGFKPVNDAYGHETGDELLRQVAQRLTDTVRKSDFTSRLAGDEFVVVSHGVTDETAASGIAESICIPLSRPFCLTDHEVTIATSVGVVLCNAQTPTTPDRLLATADKAMYEAKREGRNSYRYGSLDAAASAR